MRYVTTGGQAASSIFGLPFRGGRVTLAGVSTPTKTELRSRVLQRLKTAAAADPQQQRSAALRRRLAPLLQGTAPMTVALYAPLPHEVNLLPLLTEFPQHRYVFPSCLREHRMEFRAVSNPATEMEPAAMGIPAPKAACPAVQPQEIDLMVVPAVAFTEEGARLGYGGGYYDRYLPLCTRARLVGCAFAEQMEPALPTEEHDLRIPELFCL